MTDADLDKLEALAKGALKAKGDNARWEALDALEAAANPATILDLIASARRDAEEIGRLKRELAAADGRMADYRTVAINQGWNWSMCDVYGREEYAKHRGEHVDACALNAAEARARAAHTGEG